MTAFAFWRKGNKKIMKNVVRTLVYDKKVSLTVADTTEIINEGIQLHKLSIAPAKVFGRALSVMTFMSACLKVETGEISLAVKNDSGGDMAISGNRKLYIRGYIDCKREENEAEATEKECFGSAGSLTIVRDDGYNRPFVGTCAIPENGGVDEAFEEYYRISEQLPTRIKTCVEMDKDGVCSFAGVAVLQPLPFADEKTLEEVEKFDLRGLLDEIRLCGVERGVKNRFEENWEVWETREARYKCNCSREYLAEVLTSLGETQMRQIIREDGAVIAHCHYCNTDYEFTDEDADRIFKKS